MSHGGERRRQTQQSKLGSFKISIKEKIPGGWDSPVDLDTKVKKSSDIYPATCHTLPWPLKPN